LDDAGEAAERGYHGFDLVSGHAVATGRDAGFCLRGHLLGLGLRDPGADHGGVSPGVDARPVAADLGVALGDAPPGGFRPHLGGGVFQPLGLLGDLGDGRVEGFRGGQFREPVIDVAEHVGLSEVDVFGVADLVRQRVFGG